MALSIAELKGQSLLLISILLQTLQMGSLIRPTPWIYGQFEDNVLECCCMALSYVGYLHPADRSDPVKIGRHIAAIVNSHDDKGIVEGNWTNDYSGGTSPTAWIGSPSILQQFFRTRRPVRYGQCWTFAGVATTRKFA